MHKLFALVAVVLLAGCNSVSSVVDGTTGIVSGVIKDVSDVTTYTLDAASGAVKAATPATPEQQEFAGQGWHFNRTIL